MSEIRKPEIMVDLTPGPGIRQVAVVSSDELISRSAEAIDNAMVTITAMSKRVTDTISSMVKPPNDIEISFGIKLTIEGNAVVTKLAGEGTVAVKLSWTKTETT